MTWHHSYTRWHSSLAPDISLQQLQRKPPRTPLHTPRAQQGDTSDHQEILYFSEHLLLIINQHSYVRGQETKTEICHFKWCQIYLFEDSLTLLLPLSRTHLLPESRIAFNHQSPCMGCCIAGLIQNNIFGGSFIKLEEESNVFPNSFHSISLSIQIVVLVTFSFKSVVPAEKQAVKPCKLFQKLLPLPKGNQVVSSIKRVSMQIVLLLQL